jgi:hypothetical protein
VVNVGLFLRGYKVGVFGGRILPVLQATPNSGIMTVTGIGFMQYKINIFDRDNNVPQVRKDYKKGYDRLTNGIYIDEFLGYAFYAKNRLINFYAGLQVTSGFTRVRRDFTFDLGRKEDNNRLDFLTGFRVGWVLPIYKKNVEETYY